MARKRKQTAVITVDANETSGDVLSLGAPLSVAEPTFSRGALGVASENGTGDAVIQARSAGATGETQMNTISMSKYIDIDSSYPQEKSPVRSLGGLVFTPREMVGTASSEYKDQYDAGTPVKLDLTTLKLCFGESNVYDFATNYYGYISPSGGVPSPLTVAKVLQVTDTPDFAASTAYAVGDCVKYGTTTTGFYQCSTAISASENTGWASVSSRFTALSAFASATAYSVNAYVYSGEAVYKCVTAISADENIGLGVSVSDCFTKISDLSDVLAYATGVAYSEGTPVYQNSSVYVFTSSVSAEENTGWSEVSSSTSQATAYATGTAYTTASYVTQDGAVYKCSKALATTVNTGWNSKPVDARFEAKTHYETAASAFTRVIGMTNMFGSFTFLGSSDHSFGIAELKAVSALTQIGDKYLFSVCDVRGTQTVAEVVEKKNQFGSATGCVFVSGASELSAYMPMTIFAATDYDTGTVNCHMFKQFANESPTSIDDGAYETFNSANVNFYGRTQANASTLDFYQRGYNTNGTDTAVYCNEIWFRNACAANIMSLYMSNERVPANSFGVAMVKDAVLNICGTAVGNGMFMAKTVPTTYRTTITNLILRNGGTTEMAEESISSIETAGYCVFAYLDTDSSGEYIIHYYVFYGTADSIRFVKGDDVMIK